MLVNKLPIFFRIFLTLIGSLTAFIFPIALYYVGGLKNSLSLYITDSNCIDIFNYSLIIISLSLLVRRIYFFTSVVMMLVVYFDVVTYPNLHDYIAGLLFFMFAAVIIAEKKYIYGTLMFSNILILFIFGLYVFEIIAILTIIIYNLEISYKIIKYELNK